MMAQTQLPARNEVPQEQTWNLESIFPDVQAWEEAYQKSEKEVTKFEKYKGKLAQSAEMLLACLRLRDDVLRSVEKVAVYSGLDASTDVTDQTAQARSGQGQALENKAVAEIAFIEPEILALGREVLEGWLSEDPSLCEYEHYFDDLFRQNVHLRSAEVEEILAMSADPLGYLKGAYRSLVNADIQFNKAVDNESNSREVGQSNINGLITDPDREIRRTAWENYADGYLEHQNTIAAAQTGTFKRDVFLARARKYESSLKASLFPINIPTEVFHNLIQVFKENLPTWHRYWRIRREILGYDQLHVYDIKAPLTTTKPHISYNQAVDWICEGMAPLGDEYVEIMRSGCLENRWVDWGLNRGKRQGAFSWGTHDTQPFIMMSYTDDVFSLSTLAHELGHSMHSYYSSQNQPYIYGDYSLFVAEVASNFNQAMVREYLFRTQEDPDIQMALIEETMANYHRYFFIMPTLARFELEMHERAERGEPINARSMMDLTADLFKEGYGDEVAIDQDRIGITWAQFGHMYANFYVYQYATGISGADALVNRVLTEGEGAAEEYLNFLKAGDSLYSLDALKAAGVDLTDPEPVKTAFKFLADTVDRLEKLNT
jgi:oligoendopeptidase F